MGGYPVEMDCKLGQVSGVVGERARTPSGDSNFLSELLVKFHESCYIGAGCFDKVCFFFMIERNKWLNIKVKPYRPVLETTVG